MPADDLGHVIDCRADGWTIDHPATCRPRRCEVERAARAGFDVRPQSLGRHPCWVEAGALRVDWDRHVHDGADRIDPATAREPILGTRVNRIANLEPVDKAVIRDNFSPWRHA
jgi:hypothetical protein